LGFSEYFFVLGPSHLTDNEDPHPSLSDWHDYEPNLEFDDSELTITHENNNNDDPLFEDEDFLSSDFNNPEENPVNVSNLTNLDADNYEEQLKPLDIDEDAIRMGKSDD
jgi:Rho GTPase-activating protein 1